MSQAQNILRRCAARPPTQGKQPMAGRLVARERHEAAFVKHPRKQG